MNNKIKYLIAISLIYQKRLQGTVTGFVIAKKLLPSFLSFTLLNTASAVIRLWTDYLTGLMLSVKIW